MTSSSSSLRQKSSDYTKRDEIPFDFERRRLSVVVERQSQRILITKGAPEGIFPLLSAYEAKAKQYRSVTMLPSACNRPATN